MVTNVWFKSPNHGLLILHWRVYSSQEFKFTSLVLLFSTIKKLLPHQLTILIGSACYSYSLTLFKGDYSIYLISCWYYLAGGERKKLTQHLVDQLFQLWERFQIDPTKFFFLLRLPSSLVASFFLLFSLIWRKLRSRLVLVLTNFESWSSSKKT